MAQTREVEIVMGEEHIAQLLPEGCTAEWLKMQISTAYGCWTAMGGDPTVASLKDL